jgi:putative ABC transport system ATP-binding protein
LSEAVSVRGVVRSFGEGSARTQVLRGVDLDVQLGEMLMIVGPSGCGKTTLLSLVAGTLDCEGGEICLLGQDLQKMSRHQITSFRGKHIGFIFQKFHLIPTLSVAENTAIPLLLNGEHMKDALEKANETLEKVGLGGRGNDHPRNLSGGQQQRVAIARALVHEPELLICDEPTSALDGKNGALIMDCLKETAQTPHRCVMVVTHDSRTYKYADRIAEMEDGKILKITSQKPAETEHAHF